MAKAVADAASCVRVRVDVDRVVVAVLLEEARADDEVHVGLHGPVAPAVVRLLARHLGEDLEEFEVVHVEVDQLHVVAELLPVQPAQVLPGGLAVRVAPALPVRHEVAGPVREDGAHAHEHDHARAQLRPELAERVRVRGPAVRRRDDAHGAVAARRAGEHEDCREGSIE